VPWCSLQKNCTNGIIVILHSIGVFSCGVHFWPVELSFVGDTWFVIIYAFATLFLSMVENFAIDTEFTVSGNIGPGMVGALAGVVEVGFATLSSGTIVAPVVEILHLPVLLPLLRSESRNILLLFRIHEVLICWHGMNLWGLFVHLQPVVSEENFVGVFNGEPRLVFVWTFSGAAALNIWVNMKLAKESTLSLANLVRVSSV